MGLPAVLLAASTAVSAVGAISQGNALSSMANYQSQVSANNATIAGQYAQQATQVGEAQSYQQGLKERQQQQAITTGIAAGGVNVNTGSAAAVRQSQREIGQLDVEQVRQRAALQAYGYRTQQTGFEAESQLQKTQAGYEKTAGWLKGIGSLISGASGFANAPGASNLLPGSGAGAIPGPGTGGLY